MTQTQFTVYANTSGGSAMAWVNITVLEPAVSLSYDPYNLTLTRNVSMTPLSPTVSGGDVEVWTIAGPPSRAQLQQRRDFRHARGQHDDHDVHRLGQHLGRCCLDHGQHHRP